MLIDATHPEETRVAVVDGNRLVEYDYESKVRKQLKGSIFLAKVTRVEPSLQAAFVNFGGNRHGFLPFSEIHPDYFRIPVSDREALLAAQMAELEEHDVELEQEEAAIEQQAESLGSEAGNLEEDDEDEEEEDAIIEVGGEDQPDLDTEEEGGNKQETAPNLSLVSSQDDEEEESEDSEQPYIEFPNQAGTGYGEESEATFEQGDEQGDQPSLSTENQAEGDQNRPEGQEGRGRNNRFRGRGRHGNRGRGRSAAHDTKRVEVLGGDGVESDRPFRFNLRRSYKIQEVIKRGQIMLIQVSKEERGNKGAAVTTYLSLPGRYCVLMPNSPRGGGVSRKIESFKDRKRMKEMLTDLTVPDGMSVILRTAGVARTKVEVKRDLDYLTRLWNIIREDTLQSSAPSVIYEEGNLIKRAIRDLYGRDIEDVYVAGDAGYKSAKDFMKMLMPSHAKKVQEYTDPKIPLFLKFGVESQISDIGEPTVTLRSGGYLVINPTEALVSIDVNSGRATKERHIEETAVKTNLEAADELARQLRLRDLGGLVVVDFIDMEDRRNNRRVEQRLRDALSSDRARIQVGRISSFGLLELSRQRLNPSLAEAQQEVCLHCQGTGRVRTLDFSAISIVRAIEQEGIKGKATDITLTMTSSVALYILNNKRNVFSDMEARYGFVIRINTDDSMSQSQFKLEASTRPVNRSLDEEEDTRQGAPAPQRQEGRRQQRVPEMDDVAEEDEEDEDEDNSGNTASSPDSGTGEDRGDRSRRRGRRGGRRRGGNGEPGQQQGRSNFPSDSTPRSGNDDGVEGQDSENPSENSETRPGPRQSEGENGPRSRGRRNRGRRGNRDRGPRPDSVNADGSPSTGQNNVSDNGEPRHRAPSDNQGQQQDRGFSAPAANPEPSFTASTELSAPPRRNARPSNDRKPSENAAPREYETINQEPDKKKKGWWNRLVE